MLEIFMKKLLFIASLIFLIALVAWLFLKVPEKQQNNLKKIRVVTTLFPLYDFAKNIGQDKVEVSLLLPPGIEAHSFEPKPSDVKKINEADIFIFTGKFMEPWAEDLIKGAGNKNLQVINASEGISMLQGKRHNEIESENYLDPHIWLDFNNDKIIIASILKGLIEKDSVNIDYYQKRALEYENKISQLDIKYRIALKECKTKEVVYGGHYAFGYLANHHNLTYLAAQGISPDSEPTAKDLVQLIEQIKNNDIKYIFYEELTTPEIAETLINETGARMLLLNAAHNITKADFENNVSFLDIMEENLVNLKIGLQCN
jgi:zinc transport system substrate-binding protein